MNLSQLYKLADEINLIASTKKRGRKILEWFDLTLQLETDECKLWPFGLDSGGYGLLRYEGKNSSPHIISARIKIGEKPLNKEVAHGPCHNKRCFNDKHLSYKTSSENRIDCIRDGTHNAGESNGSAKLSSKEVLEIRSSSDSQKILAKRYGISQPQISKILLGARWKSVGD